MSNFLINNQEIREENLRKRSLNDCKIIQDFVDGVVDGIEYEKNVKEFEEAPDLSDEQVADILSILCKST